MKSFLAVDFLATLGLLVNYVQLIGFSFRNCQFFVNRYFSSYCSLHQCVCLFVCLFVFGAKAPSGPGPPHS